MAIQHRNLPTPTFQDVERFWTKITITPTCWWWNRSTSGHRYGHFRCSDRNVYAHRFAYQVYYGVDPGPSFVCHKCDNPRCVNPLHLFLGDQKANMRDAISKKRHAHGTRVVQSKLKEQDVQEIRDTYKPRAKGRSMYALARRFNVTQATIYRVLSRHCWKHI